MLSLTNRLSSSGLQRNSNIHTKNVARCLVQYYRSASVKLTPHDVSISLNYGLPQCFPPHLLWLKMQVNQILYEKEFSMELTESSVKGYDSNQVASNNPLEDRRSEASCLYTNGKTSR